MSNKTFESDHDLLVRIDERVQKLDKCMTNHLSEHWKLTLLALSAALAALAGIVTVLIT